MSDTNWYFKKPNNSKTGPYNIEQIKTKAAKNPTAQAMLEGSFDWTNVADIPELGLSTNLALTPQNTNNPQPHASQSNQNQNSNKTTSDPTTSRVRDHESPGVDYRIYGDDMQFVEIELDPGESCIAEAGALMYKHPRVKMDTVFGDGSEQKDTGFLGLLAGAGKRLITGESLFTTVFTHNGHGKAHVSFASPYPGKIVPMHMSDYMGKIVCQKDAFLCASKNISIGIHFQKKMMTGLFGGEGFILQKLTADISDNEAISFIHAGGTIIEKNLEPGDVLEIDTGCLVAMTTGIDFDVKYIGSIKTAVFGGEGLFLGTLKAERAGKVWLQSLPFSRLAGRILANVQRKPGSPSGGEGSILGGLGSLIDGDNF